MILTSVNLDSFPVQRWARKGDMPDHLKSQARRVCFRFEIAWIAVEPDGAVRLKDGSYMPCYIMNLKTPGWVIGRRDCQSASIYPWSYEWQTGCADRMLEAATLVSEVGGRH